jgi:hypothetical protein
MKDNMLIMKARIGLLQRLIAFVVLVGGLAGCGGGKSPAVSKQVEMGKLFPTVAGWTVSEAVQTYDHDHLYNLVDGQADSFFVYGFEQVATGRYQNEAGVRLSAEIWRLATPADAYGLFSAGRAGAPAVLGNEADTDPGLRVAFWQDRYFVSLSVDQAVPEATLLEFGQGIATALPKGGETPTIVGRLPAGGLVDRSAIFFHEEMSIQMEIWLGGENLLGLSHDTNGVVGHYKLGEANAWLMLIEYPKADQTAGPLEILEEGQISDVVVAGSKGKLLGAVFGKVEAAQAQALLDEALK